MRVEHLVTHDRVRIPGWDLRFLTVASRHVDGELVTLTFRELGGPIANALHFTRGDELEVVALAGDAA